MQATPTITSIAQRNDAPHAPFLPLSKAEMKKLGWDQCDIIIVTGDAYVDHPSFGMAIIGRLLESQGFKVGIIAQPDWQSAEAFKVLGKPRLFFGVAAGNMDSMINRYTADRKIRSDDAYTPGGKAGSRPDRASIVYSQRCREAYKEVPIVLGGIEASLRRIAHYDYWQDKVRRSILLDSRADILLYGNAERAIVEVAQRMSAGESVGDLTDVRGTAFIRTDTPEGWMEIDSTRIDRPGKIDRMINPYVNTRDLEQCALEKGSKEEPEADEVQVLHIEPKVHLDRSKTVIRIPPFEKVSKDPVLYAHASRVLHLETNPGNARALVQQHGDQEVWLNPPPIPLTTEEMDFVFGLNYARVPHPIYKGQEIPAYKMIRFSVNIMRGCFGGCTFCSITEHEGRIIQNRSHESILNEIEEIRDKVPGFTGVISDLGGPTANMYRIACKSPEIEKSCRKLSCVYPEICHNLNTDHSSLTELYRKARKTKGVKKVMIASGLRYDLAVEDPEYVKELVTHHVGGYLKIAPEHTERGPLDHMMKPGIGTYDAFKKMFERFSKEAGKDQYLIPYFIAAHPGTTDEDMMNLAVWLKRNDFKADQVQAFYPSPMATATASTLAQAEVEISDARVRAVPPGQKMTGAFMDIKNSGADLQVVSAESSISKVVELHTHIKDGEVMRMRKIPAIDLPANSTTHLKPGGLHVMFIGLKEPLSIDQTIDLKLNFSDGTSQALEVPVKMIQKPGMKKEMKHDMQH